MISPDLNLLPILLDLLETGSVTRTAERLGRSQPAVSQALAKLRSHFDDPLFIRDGQRLVPTQRARALEPTLTRNLADLGALFGGETTFEPGRTQRLFRIACPDYLRDLLLDRLSAFFAEAPQGQVEFQSVQPSSWERLARGDLAAVITAETPSGNLGALIESHPFERISWGVFCQPNHRYARNMTLETWRGCGHVQVVTGAGRRSDVDEALGGEAFRRRVRVRVADHASALSAVARTDFLFTAPSAQLSGLAEQIGLWTLPAPLDLAPMEHRLCFNRADCASGAGRWFREMLWVGT